jgi:large subunit ribosomal protein L4e
MKGRLMSLKGKARKNIDLPELFDELYRPDLIKKAVVVSQANRRQAYGPQPTAGLKTSAESWGSGRGVAQVPRLKNSSRVARVPQAVGGRKAHPPNSKKVFFEKINKKERQKAMRSAIAATAKPDLVKARGHRFEGTLPLILEDAFEELATTSEIAAVLAALNVWQDVEKAKCGKRVRAGKGKRRGRRYKHKKSVLIICTRPVLAARNLPGVDVVAVDQLNVELLAPGTHAGRLTIWTQSAINALGKG